MEVTMKAGDTDSQTVDYNPPGRPRWVTEDRNKKQREAIAVVMDNLEILYATVLPLLEPGDVTKVTRQMVFDIYDSLGRVKISMLPK